MNKGATLIELLVAAGLIVTLSVSILWIFAIQSKMLGATQDRAALRQSSQQAMERMVRELSQTDSITTALADEITFLADLDDDGSNETITFDVSGNQLQRTEATVVTVLSSYVQTFTLSYRDLDNNLLSLPADTSSQSKRDDIRIITISLTTGRDDETMTLNSSVYARNNQ